MWRLRRGRDIYMHGKLPKTTPELIFSDLKSSLDPGRATNQRTPPYDSRAGPATKLESIKTGIQVADIVFAH